MSVTPRVSRPLGHLAMAAVVAIVTGCAGTPPSASPQATSAAVESPASASQLVDTADFAKKAQDEGWVPQVRDGNVVYCKDESPIGSRLPEKTCLDKVAVQQMMLAEEQQRENMQRAAAAAGMNGN